jgi:hypothetical protein
MAPTTEPWVDARPFRAHLRHLMAVGDLTAAEVADLAGLSPRLATSLLHGRNGRPVRRISSASASALLTVTAQQTRTLRSAQVPSAVSRRRLERLLEQGTSPAVLAAQLGVTTLALLDLAEPSTRWCSALLALRLAIAERGRHGVDDCDLEAAA